MNDIHPFWLVAGTAIVALVPTVVGLATSYLKVSIVVGMVRSALGTQQVPGGLVVMALSLAVTAIVMAPVFEASIAAFPSTAVPELREVPSPAELTRLGPALEPWLSFVRRHAGAREIAILASIRTLPTTPEVVTASLAEPGFGIVLAAFVLTELKEAFSMSFVLLLPFLVIDLVVANILAGMGMFMVSPQMISLPLKLMLFVLADGWILLARGLIVSYGG